MKLYKKWIDKELRRLDNEVVLVTGADGSIGYFITYYLAYLGAKIVMVVKDINKANQLKEKILKDFPNTSLSIEYVDFFELDTIKKVVPILKKYNPKYLINNAGVYHLPNLKNKEGIERTFCVNFYGQYLLTNELKNIIKKNKGKVINQCSISAKWVNIKKLKFDDLNFDDEKSLTQKYAKTKIAMILATLKAKEAGFDMVLVHPGASATSLFSSSRGGFTKHFNRAIVPLMKLIFISPSKASLPTLFAINHDTKFDEWIGPRGLFNIWGYPKISKLSKKFIDPELSENFFNSLTKFENKIK
jgi:NAD(P)-dependent dehydrogenase (short-subunit alcohol dehydrogenase family)